MLAQRYVHWISLLREKVPSFSQYPFCLPVVRSLERVDLHPKVTCFIGENGSGKSTLLEAIAVNLGFNAEGGSKNFNFGTRRSHSPILMAYPDSLIYQCAPEGVTPIAYEDTEHYRVTRDFLTHRQRTLRVLMDNK
jgi:predicted ATPase